MSYNAPTARIYSAVSAPIGTQSLVIAALLPRKHGDSMHVIARAGTSTFTERHGVLSRTPLRFYLINIVIIKMIISPLLLRLGAEEETL